MICDKVRFDIVGPSPSAVKRICLCALSFLFCRMEATSKTGKTVAGSPWACDVATAGAIWPGAVGVTTAIHANATKENFLMESDTRARHWSMSSTLYV